MWRKEIRMAVDKKQSITIRTLDGEVLHGIPEACTDRVKMRSEYVTAWVPLEEIEHVSRLIQLKKKDPVT